MILREISCDLFAYGRPSIIFFEYASPIPGSDFNWSPEAELMSIRLPEGVLFLACVFFVSGPLVLGTWAIVTEDTTRLRTTIKRSRWIFIAPLSYDFNDLESRAFAIVLFVLATLTNGGVSARHSL